MELTDKDFKATILNEVRKNKFAVNGKTRKIETIKRKHRNSRAEKYNIRNKNFTQWLNNRGEVSELGGRSIERFSLKNIEKKDLKTKVDAASGPARPCKKPDTCIVGIPEGEQGENNATTAKMFKKSCLEISQIG